MKKFWAVSFLILAIGCSPKANPVANSILSYLQKVQDGVIFSEGFENPNWLSAEGWTTVQGSPLRSSSVAELGLYSFQCTGTTGTLSVISKVIAANAGLVIGWFYDDPTQTTQPGPYLKVHFTNGQYMSVGVRNGVDTTHYSYVAPGTVDQPTTASTFARASGWHQFVFAAQLGELYIDTVGVLSFTPGLLVDTVYIQSGKVGDTGSTFGYFDEINAYANSYITVNIGDGVARKMNFYFASNSEAAGFSAGTTFSMPFYNLEGSMLPVNFPQSIFIEVSNNLYVNRVEWRSILTKINPGDIYIYQSVKFAHKVQDWQPRENDLLNQNQSTSGVTETLFNGFKPQHTFTAKNGIGLALKNQLNNFYAYCAQGPPFSMMIDSNNGAFGVLSAAPAVAAQSITVMPTLSTNPNDNFTVGRQYRIFDGSGQRRQKVTLASKTSTTQLNFTEYLTQPFAQGDYICDDTFMPFLEVFNNPDGFNFTNPGYLWFDWAQKCQEFTSA